MHSKRINRKISSLLVAILLAPSLDAAGRRPLVNQHKIGACVNTGELVSFNIDTKLPTLVYNGLTHARPVPTYSGKDNC